MSPFEMLQAVLQARLPDALTTLKPPGDIRDLEPHFPSLTAEVREELSALYRWHDGQQAGQPGLLFGLRFLPVQEVLREYQQIRELPPLSYEASWPPHAAYVSGNRERIPLFSDFSGNYLSLDLDPDREGRRGQIVVEGVDQRTVVAISSSITDLLSWFTSALQAGNYDYTDHGHCFGELNLKHPRSTHLLDVLAELPLPLGA